MKKLDKLACRLDESCLRYLQIRLDYLKAKMNKADLVDVDTRRTIVHNALIADFTAVLRNMEDKPPDMIEAYDGGRKAIGIWGLKRALDCLLGTRKALSDEMS